jgi:N-acetylneuraminic acid mutarotase
MGGCSNGQPPAECNTMTPSVQVFQLYNNYSGAPALYSAASNLFTSDRLGHGTAVLNGYIYVAGGCTGLGDCSIKTDNSQFAPIDAYGNIGTWADTTDSTLPASKGWGEMVAVGGSLYFIGGQASLGGTTSTVYYATPSPTTGNISSWNSATNGLPAAREKHAATVWNDRIYVVGGYNGTSVQSTVYVSPQLSSGGDITSAWTSTTGFNVARSGTTAITYANNIYILGGSSDNGTTILSDVQFAKLNSDGTIPSGSWTYTSSLPDKLYGADGFAYNGFMYLFGGRASADVCETNTIAAPISGNTTIISGNNPTGIGEWFETNEKYAGSRYGSQAVYHEGKAYITGGGCGSTLTYTGANRVVQTTLLTQPQVAKYSRLIDTDTDVFPTQWLMNGLDNDIGARWQMKYSSSTDANAEWGQETNFGEVTLGQTENYIPLDDTGTDTNFARYYYFTVSIDSSQAYGYPEDVTRGPTIDDITLFFTSDPSKRLRHGKTFTGGELQPLDTPPPPP